MSRLTSHLLHLDGQAVEEATQHPFLQATAKNQLDPERLKTWLAQDRLYQQAYINFVGVMLSKVVVPNGGDRATTLQWRAADLLIESLTNIREEMKLFEETAKIEDLFAGATTQSRPLLEGLTVLWATEECYLRAWQYARTQLDTEMNVEDQGVVHKTLIPDWTSAEFEAFVGRIRALVDELGAVCEESGIEWKECEIAWRQVLWAERGFWPKVDV